MDLHRKKSQQIESPHHHDKNKSRGLGDFENASQNQRMFIKYQIKKNGGNQSVYRGRDDSENERSMMNSSQMLD